jgi:hypothetical protein
VKPLAGTLPCLRNLKGRYSISHLARRPRASSSQHALSLNPSAAPPGRLLNNTPAYRQAGPNPLERGSRKPFGLILFRGTSPNPLPEGTRPLDSQLLSGSVGEDRCLVVGHSKRYATPRSWGAGPVSLLRPSGPGACSCY